MSAFSGANEEAGRLGEFLAAVEHGDIKPGSYLLVESLDRLSRKKPSKAVRLLERICEAGITLVTLDDQRVYTEEVLDEDQTAHGCSFGGYEGARGKCQERSKGCVGMGEQADKCESKPLTSRAPGWLKLVGKTVSAEFLCAF